MMMSAPATVDVDSMVLSVVITRISSIYVMLLSNCVFSYISSHRACMSLVTNTCSLLKWSDKVVRLFLNPVIQSSLI